LFSLVHLSIEGQENGTKGSESARAQLGAHIERGR